MTLFDNWPILSTFYKLFHKAGIYLLFIVHYFGMLSIILPIKVLKEFLLKDLSFFIRTKSWRNDTIKNKHFICYKGFPILEQFVHRENYSWIFFFFSFSHKVYRLTVDPWADVKNGFTWKIIIVLKVRGGNGELKFS